MKRFLAVIFILALLISVFSVSALAYTLDDGAGNLVENGDDPEENVTAEGDYINLTGGSISLSGNIGGDVIGFFSSLSTDGLKLGGSGRFVAIQAKLKDTDCRNLTFFCGDAVIEPGVNAGSVVIYATGTVVFSGSCESLTVYADRAEISGEVKTRAKINANQVYLSPESAINEISVTSSAAPLLTDGKTNAVDSEVYSESLTWHKINIWKDAFYTFPSVMICAIAGALVIQLVFGNSVRSTAEVFKEHPFRYTLGGLFILLCVPGIIIFFVTLSPDLSVSLLLIYLAVVFASKLMAGGILAARLLPNMNRFFSAVIVTTTLSLLCALPYIGTVATLVSVCITFGHIRAIMMAKLRAKAEQIQAQQPKPE